MSGREANAIEESRDVNVEVEVAPKWQQDASAVIQDLSQRRISMTVLRNVIPTEGLSSLEAPHQWRQRSEVLLRSQCTLQQFHALGSENWSPYQKY